MDEQTLSAALTACLEASAERLEEASGLAKAATGCVATAGNDKAIEISHDIEQLLYEVTTLLNSASLMNRIFKTD